MISGSIVACVGIILRAAMLRRVAIVIGGGLAGVIGGWLLGSFLVNGANWNLERLMESFLSPADPADNWPEWLIAVCLTPYGMWLGLLVGARKARQGPS
jgi:hypothetical protein